MNSDIYIQERKKLEMNHNEKHKSILNLWGSKQVSHTERTMSPGACGPTSAKLKGLMNNKPRAGEWYADW